MLEEQVHVVVVDDCQVEVPSLQLERDALPAVERKLSELLVRHRIEVLPEQPEPRVRAAEMKVLDVVQAAAGGTRDRLEVLAGLQLFR